MSEAIYKLQPNRTMHLRGFDRRGAAAAMVGASESGFAVKGVFRDMADFAVLTLWDADNFFEHPRLKYLPDFDFSGITLQFDVTTDGLQPIDSVKHSWIDWAELDYVDANGTVGKFRLFDPVTEAGVASPVYAREKATAEFVVTGAEPVTWDRVTLWYQNFAFDYILDKKLFVEYAFYAAGPTTQHWIMVGARVYGYIEQEGDSSAAIAGHLAARVNGTEGGFDPDPEVSAEIASDPWVVKLKRKLDNGASTAVNASGFNTADTIWQIGPKTVAQELVDQINGADYSSVSIPLSATRTGAAQTTIKVQAERAGVDGNFITMYAQSKTGTLILSPSSSKFSGGVTSTAWHVTLDFSAIGLSSLRKAWLTFAPALPDSDAYGKTEWTAAFSNWTVTDANGKRALRVAGPGSVRVHSRDAWVKYEGAGWSEEAGWFVEGFAKRSATVGGKATIKYHCQFAHDLYVGTSLYTDRGSFGVKLDGVNLAPLNCFLDDEPAVNSRRKIASNVAAGEHVVELIHASGQYVYFDFLEAAVPADVPDAEVVYPNVTAAVDYGTDHTYKLPPERLVWNLDKLGLHGQVNEYVSVFWWNERKRVGGGPAYRDVTFTGPFTAGADKYVMLHFGQDEFTHQPGPPSIRKTIFPKDDPVSIARHVVYAINQTFVACWAEFVSGSGDSATIRIWQHSPVWTVFLAAQTNAGGAVSGASDLLPVAEGTWAIDEAAVHAINFPTRAWHDGFFRAIAAKGWGAVAAFSMELVDPPDDPVAGKVFAARFHDGTAVETDIGFANLKSTHCSFTSAMQGFQKQAYLAVADLMAAAGLTPWLQFGEFLWWFFPRRAWPIEGATNAAPIEITTVEPHGWSTGDYVIVAGVRGNVAANGTWTITVTGPTTFRLNGSSGNGAFVFNAAASVRGGSMAFYDQETRAAARSALGRELALFNTQDDDPEAVNGGADADFLAGRIKAHIDGIRSHVLATHPAAKFELLYPDDVNNAACYHTLDLPYPQGGRLNRRVNLPVEYQQKAGSGLDRLKMEALSWGAFYRNMDLAAEAIRFPSVSPMAWSKSDTAYLMPIFNGGCPWEREFLAAVNHGVPLVALWAFDHLTLYSWPLPLPVNGRTVTFT